MYSLPTLWMTTGIIYMVFTLLIAGWFFHKGVVILKFLTDHEATNGDLSGPATTAEKVNALYLFKLICVVNEAPLSLFLRIDLLLLPITYSINRSFLPCYTLRRSFFFHILQLSVDFMDSSHDLPYNPNVRSDKTFL